MVAVEIEEKKTGDDSSVSRSIIPFPLEGRALLLKERFVAEIDEFLQYNSVRLNGYRVGEIVIQGGVSEDFLEQLRDYGFNLLAGPVTFNYSLVPHQERAIYAISIGDKEMHKVGLILESDEPTVRETESGNPSLFPEVTNNRLSTPEQKLDFGLFLVRMAKASQNI